MPSLWIDLSTATKWTGPPVGIVRTEVRVAQELLAAHAARLRFCCFDAARRVFREIPGSAAEDLLQRLDSATPKAEPRHGPWMSALRTCKAQLERVVRRCIGLLPGKTRQPLEDWLAAWVALARASTALLASVIGLFRVRSNRAPLARFGHGDIYLSMGADWIYNDLKALETVKRSHGLRVFLLCYDLIPIYQPHFLMPGLRPMFQEHYTDLLSCADVVFAISQESRRQLLRYARETGSRIPSTEVVSLGANIRPQRLESVPQLVSQPFILTVSTVEVRKNHRLLYQIWTRMRSDPECPALPHLVMVGRRGWRIDDFLDEMNENPDARDVIHHFESVSDGQLEWLYGNCLFTVFPSLCEGFGLPVIESLAHGKCCISSNTSSLPEAGQNLAMLIDPLDFAAWYAAIKALVLDESMRRDNEARIRHRFTMTTWKDTAEAMYRTIQATTGEQATSGGD